MATHTWTRWVRFSLVGTLGIGVQLGVLTSLVRLAGWHYLPATAVAVEAAVLHNFWWHHVWTWRDRPPGTSRRMARRLLAFHGLNGTMSLSGNVALVALLVPAFGIDPILGNLVAIAACSAVTFVVCDRRVFARAAAASALVLAAASTAAVVRAAGPVETAAPAAQPQPATLEAWATYTDRVNARHEAATTDATPFFALDAFGVSGWRDAAIAGRVPAFEFEHPRPSGPSVRVPDGAIHHWTGAVFLPGITAQVALDRVQRLAGQEVQHYDDVLASKLLARGDGTARVFMRLQRTKVITATYDTEHTIHYRRIGPRRAAVRSVAMRIAELQNAGTPREREVPPEDDRGFLWRLNAYWRYEETAAGTFIECESVSLSRSVPVLLRPFLSGIVDGLARESLERTLVGLRRALTSPGTGRRADGQPSSRAT